MWFKIIGDYNNYEFAKYKGQTVSCKWLNYPKKKNTTDLICNSTDLKNIGVEQETIEEIEEETVEGFGNIISNKITTWFDSIDYEFLLKFIIIVLVLLLVIRFSKKNIKHF